MSHSVGSGLTGGQRLENLVLGRLSGLREIPERNDRRFIAGNIILIYIQYTIYIYTIYELYYIYVLYYIYIILYYILCLLYIIYIYIYIVDIFSHCHVGLPETESHTQKVFSK